MKTVKVIAMLAIVISLFVSMRAQAAIASTDTIENLATSQQITPADLGVPVPSFWQSTKRKMLRLFTRSVTEKAKYSIELANLTLLEAKLAAEAGDSDRSERLIESYNSQIAQVSDSIAEITNQFQDSLNPDTRAVLDKITQTRLFEVSLLDSMNLQALGELNQKLAEVRSQALKDLAKILAAKDMTADERAKKLSEIIDKFNDKELKAEEKFGKKIGALDDLDEASDDEALKDSIEAVTKTEINEISKTLDDETLQKIALDAGDNTNKDLIVLQLLVNKVPTSARPAIQAKIDREIAKLSSEIKEDPAKINKRIEKSKQNLESKLELIQKIEEANKEADQKVQEVIKETNQQIQEAQKESKDETRKEDIEDEEDDKTGDD